MRIIDKNYDYYDYLQSYDDTLVFDRRGSFILTKKDICDKLRYLCHKEKYLLLQCGATYWVFKINATSIDEHGWETDCTFELIDKWKDYKKPRTTISIRLFSLWWSGAYSRNELNRPHLDSFKIRKEIVKTYKGTFTQEYYDLPLLKGSGITDFIPEMEIFSAIEEGLSLDKSDKERTEPLGATNEDKIVMHGFDTKESFRGKRQNSNGNLYK